jgi:hypothetical protein
MASLLDSPIGLRAAWTELFISPPARKLPSQRLSAWLSIAVPTRGSPAPPLITCSNIHPNSNHSQAIPYPLHPPTQPPCRAPSRSKAARATLPHRESSSLLLRPQSRPHNLPDCLLHRLLFSAPILDCYPLHLTCSHFHHQQPTPPIDTMVTRPTPTTANAMDSRTPQNTPAQNAPISSRAQAPSVSDIKEGWSSLKIIKPGTASRTGHPTNNFHRHRGS